MKQRKQRFNCIENIANVISLNVRHVGLGLGLVLSRETNVSASSRTAQSHLHQYVSLCCTVQSSSFDDIKEDNGIRYSLDLVNKLVIIFLFDIIIIPLFDTAAVKYCRNSCRGWIECCIISCEIVCVLTT